MASAAFNFGDNRFALLSPSPRSKRKKTINLCENFPELPVTKKDDPKFIVIKPTDTNKTFSNYSIFSIHKALLAICKEINSINFQSDGGLILLVKNRQTAKKFIDARLLPGICEITAKYHDNLNNIKGTVYAPFLNNVPEPEIIEELKSYNVTSVYKFQRPIDGVLKPTGVILISFDSYFLPEKIDIAWITTKVRPHYPNPMRCKICQKLGHTQKFCKNLPACPICSLPPHIPDACIRTFCANCSGEHAASSNTCPKYMQAKEVLKIKTQEKCTLKEANKIYKIRNPLPPAAGSFANTLKSTNSLDENTTTNINSIPARTPNISANNTSEQIPKEFGNVINEIKNKNTNKVYQLTNNDLQSSELPTCSTSITLHGSQSSDTSPTHLENYSLSSTSHILKTPNNSSETQLKITTPDASPMEIETNHVPTLNFKSHSLHANNNSTRISTTTSALTEYMNSKAVNKISKPQQ